MEVFPAPAPGTLTLERGDCEVVLAGGGEAVALPIPWGVWLLDLRLLPPRKLRRELMPPIEKGWSLGVSPTTTLRPWRFSGDVVVVGWLENGRWGGGRFC